MAVYLRHTKHNLVLPFIWRVDIDKFIKGCFNIFVLIGIIVGKCRFDSCIRYFVPHPVISKHNGALETATITL